MPRVINNANFTELVLRSKERPLVMVDCYSPWCGPCKAMDKIVGELSQEYKGRVRIGKMNVDDMQNQRVCNMFNITSIPTFLFFKKGKLVHRVTGGVQKNVLVSGLAKLLSNRV